MTARQDSVDGVFESGKIKKGLGALDVMILILLAVVIGYVGLRVLRDRGSGSEQSAGSHYTIEFRIQDIRNSSYENYLFQQKGTTFYMKESGEEFGVLLENAAPIMTMPVR